jgi:hypothetical protein
LSTSDNNIEVSKAFIKSSSGSINSKSQSEGETVAPHPSQCEYEQTSIEHSNTSIEFPRLDDLNQMITLKVSNDPQQSLTTISQVDFNEEKNLIKDDLLKVSNDPQQSLTTISQVEFHDNKTDGITKQTTSSPDENNKMKSKIKFKPKNIRASTVMEF